MHIQPLLLSNNKDCYTRMALTQKCLCASADTVCVCVCVLGEGANVLKSFVKDELLERFQFFHTRVVAIHRANESNVVKDSKEHGRTGPIRAGLELKIKCLVGQGARQQRYAVSGGGQEVATSWTAHTNFQRIYCWK